MDGAVSKPVELVFIRDNTRRYVIWEGEIDGQHIVIHGFGALFPERYLPSRSAEASIWQCPVRTCGQAFATPPDLGDHFLKFHAEAILHDHLDGTFSVLPQDPESAYDAKRQPYVASQGCMLQSPSLRQPSHSVPLQPGPGALDTPDVPTDNHDLSNPRTGNKPSASSSEVNNNDNSDGSSDTDGDRSDADENDGHDADDSDESGDNSSDGSDIAFVLAMESQHLGQTKRKATNDEIAPEPKRAKASQAPIDPKIKKVKEWEMRENRISESRTQPAEWETKWGRLPHHGATPAESRALAYSSSLLTSSRRFVDYDDTTFQVVKIPRSGKKAFTANVRAYLFVVKQGLVSVLVPGNDIFTISADGCWSIQPGQSCTIKRVDRETETVIYIYSRPTQGSDMSRR